VEWGTAGICMDSRCGPSTWNDTASTPAFTRCVCVCVYAFFFFFLLSFWWKSSICLKETVGGSCKWGPWNPGMCLSKRLRLRKFFTLSLARITLEQLYDEWGFVKDIILKLPMLCCLSQAPASTDFDKIGEELEHSCDVQDLSVEDSSWQYGASWTDWENWSCCNSCPWQV
jgi:hypothetical protein